MDDLTQDKRACAFKPNDEKHTDEDVFVLTRLQGFCWATLQDFFKLLRQYHRQGAVLCSGLMVRGWLLGAVCGVAGCGGVQDAGKKLGFHVQMVRQRMRF